MWIRAESTVFDVRHSYWTFGYGSCQNYFVNIRLGRLHGQCPLMIAGHWMQYHAQQFRCRITSVGRKIKIEFLNHPGKYSLTSFAIYPLVLSAFDLFRLFRAKISTRQGFLCHHEPSKILRNQWSRVDWLNWHPSNIARHRCRAHRVGIECFPEKSTKNWLIRV